MATDSEMLRALLDDERIDNEERDNFEDVNRQLKQKKLLSRKQHQWVESRWKQLGLDAEEPSQNLFSSGKVKSEKTSVIFPWENQNYVKPLKPPGKK